MALEGFGCRWSASAYDPDVHLKDPSMTSKSSHITYVRDRGGSRYSVNGQEIPQHIWRMVNYIPIVDTKPRTQTCSVVISIVTYYNVRALPYNIPVVKISIAPILRRVGSCICITAIMGKINMTISMAKPTDDCKTHKTLVLCATLGDSCTNHLSPRPGVEEMNSTIVIVP